MTHSDLLVPPALQRGNWLPAVASHSWKVCTSGRLSMSDLWLGGRQNYRQADCMLWLALIGMGFELSPPADDCRRCPALAVNKTGLCSCRGFGNKASLFPCSRTHPRAQCLSFKMPRPSSLSCLGFPVCFASRDVIFRAHRRGP